MSVPNLYSIQPRELNHLADYFSHVVDYDDWYIDPKVFAMVEEWWGPHTIDRFAASYNNQVSDLTYVMHFQGQRQ